MMIFASFGEINFFESLGKKEGVPNIRSAIETSSEIDFSCSKLLEEDQILTDFSAEVVQRRVESELNTADWIVSLD